jgi:hypothetical protein
MQIDPTEERQRLSSVYRRMYDDELINLAADSQDLTDIARRALDDELKRRSLGDLSNAGSARESPEPRRERRGALLGNQGGAAQIVIDHRSLRTGEAPLEYTWKTLLCECESMEQAKLLCETLRRAGIDNWIDGQGAGVSYKGLGVPRPRVMVAADQLDRARPIASNPIPEEIIEESMATVEAFDIPRCPRCGSKDPALEGVNPFNSWRCEACGNQWTDSEEDQASNLASGGSGTS